MTWPNIKQSENTEMFKSKLRYQVTQIKLKSKDCEIISDSRSATETSVFASAKTRRIFNLCWTGTTGRE